MAESQRPERPQKSLERQIRAFHWIRLLAELSGRHAGTDQEGEAARRVESWLRELGIDEITYASVPSRPHAGWVWAAHLCVAALGCAFGGIAGAALAGTAALSFRREAAGGRPLLSRGWPARDSQNVVGRVGAERPRRRVVLTANLDAARPSRLFGSPLVGRFAAPRPGGRPPRGVAAPPALLLGAAALVTAASALGADGAIAAAARAVLGVALVALAVAAVRWALAGGSAGANDNASGVAAMLSAAEQLAAQLPPGVELWCAATGAGQNGSRGVHALLDAHPEWRIGTTAFVNFCCVGSGALHCVRSEGSLERTAYPPMLLELARRVASSGGYGEVTPADVAIDTGGQVAAQRGGHALSLVALDANGLPRAFRGAGDRPEHVDTETVIRAADFACCVVSAYLRGDAEPLAYV